MLNMDQLVKEIKQHVKECDSNDDFEIYFSCMSLNKVISCSCGKTWEISRKDLEYVENTQFLNRDMIKDIVINEEVNKKPTNNSISFLNLDLGD